jgi:murein DD-endopeptidase MepM/ murein hydrolase activator NlpD
VIQPGDTISSISVRFNIAIVDIVNANNLENPDQLFVGTELILPGLDWIDGVLTTQSMPYGETLRSLSRRYHADVDILKRLSRISSPGQLYVDYPVTLPIERGEDLTSARSLVSPQFSLLEMAVLSGTNPWSVVAANRLQGTWEALPGDVLLMPGTTGPGPGALPSPINQVEFSTTNFVQGKTSVVRVRAEDQLALSGQLIDKQLNFYQEEAGSYVVLQGIHVQLEPGWYPLLINGQAADGAPFAFSQNIRVRDGGYGSETLTVEDEELLDADLDASEAAQVASMVVNPSAEKLWNGYFQVPSPYGDTINSFFGIARSYNGGIYESVHMGVDFGGGLGVEIYAPADGVVIFAGPLEIRGNATIIDHGWGVYTGYWHQSEIRVQVGDVVTPGQVIGIVGNSGRSSGAHMHWEVWVGGVQVEPLDWLAVLYP